MPCRKDVQLATPYGVLTNQMGALARRARVIVTYAAPATLARSVGIPCISTTMVIARAHAQGATPVSVQE